MGRIIDYILFYNELDMLELRFLEHNDFVDEFIIVEASSSFSGLRKDLIFQQNKKRFEKYIKKITYLNIEVFPERLTVWERESYQRNFGRDYLKRSMKQGDIVLCCDLDEIVSQDALKVLKKDHTKDDTFMFLQMDMYYYNFNWYNPTLWNRAFVIGKNHINKKLNDIRNLEYDYPGHIIYAGWHLSYFLSPEDISKKIKAFSHQEYNTDHYTELERIKKCMKEGIDLFERNEQQLIKYTGRQLPKNKNFLESVLNSYLK